MPANRIPRMNDVLRQEIAAYLTREVEFPLGSMVTVTKVDTTEDLAEAKVWVSVYPESFRGTCLEKIEKTHRDLHRTVGKKVRTFRMPRLMFKIDTTEEKADEILSVLDELKK